MIKFLKRWMPSRDEVGKPTRTARRVLNMLRREYNGKPLLESEICSDPMEQFSNWFDQAIKNVRDDPNAMLLSTADKNGRPSSRTVLLKEFDETGLVFYTNYESRKARQILENPNVCLTFYWPDLLRQIHIEGRADKVPESQSDAYFKTRPTASQLGAWTSIQSKPIPSREELIRRFKNMEEKFDQQEIPRPPHWGGFKVTPHRFEFWQGRMNRLHDRIQYTRTQSSWNIERLSP